MSRWLSTLLRTIVRRRSELDSEVDIVLTDNLQAERSDLPFREFVADHRALPGGLADRFFERVAFGTHLGGDTELAFELCVLVACVLERAVEGFERTGQLGALDGVRVSLASEASGRLGERRQAGGRGLALGCEREGAVLEGLDARRRPALWW